MLHIISDERFALHQAGAAHLESPERWRVADEALRQLTGLSFGPARLASDEEIARVHPDRHLALLQTLCEEGGGAIDADTGVSAASCEIMRLAAGAAIESVQRAHQGQPAYALARPPGHHALADRAMGFCLLNNAAIAARHAQVLGMRRVAIVDWDVHHGNGTEAIFQEDPDVLYVSTHQQGLYPGTGAANDIGSGAGEGRTVNIPLPPGTGDAGFMRAFEHIIEPVLVAFEPDLILVSAGYDAHWRDPLGGMALSSSGYGALALRVLNWAQASCGGRLAFLLEGGYDLDALAASVAATAAAITGSAIADPCGPGPMAERTEAIDRQLALVRDIQSRWWPCLTRNLLPPAAPAVT